MGRLVSSTVITGNTGFLLRPAALPGESLSSWRQRCAWENGYRLYPVPDERTRRVDPDIGDNDADVMWVANLHGADAEKVIAMTLRRYVGTVVEHVASRSQPRWWLRSRYGSKPPSYGPMYCSTCLATDSVPYFRLAWRFGFYTACSIHGVSLLDHCAGCGSAPWPSGCGIQSRIHQAFTSLRYCWHCGADLARAQTGAAAIVNETGGWLATKVLTLGDKLVPSHEAFSAVRAICQLFLRNRPRICIEQSDSRWSSVAESLSADAKNTQAVEHLRVKDRCLLVPAAFEVMHRWPDAFISFARDAKVTKAHFNGAESLHPKWMTEVVNSSLAMQNRSVTESTLRDTVANLSEKFARPPTKTELRQNLNWQGDKGLDKVFSKRNHASLEEWQQLIAEIARLEQTSAASTRSHNAFTIEIAVLLICLLKSFHLKDAAEIPKSNLRTTLKDCQLPADAEHGLQSLHTLVVAKLVKVESSPIILLPIRARQVRKCLKHLMTGLPGELARDARVFSKAAGLNWKPGARCDSPSRFIVAA